MTVEDEFLTATADDPGLTDPTSEAGVDLLAVEPGCQAWPIIWPCPTEGVDPELLAAAQSLAEQLLWSLSGYRVGICTFREAYRPAAGGWCGYPYKDRNGHWRNGRLGDCCRILLTHRPVRSITEVVEEGVVLDPAAYALEGSYLRNRLGCWPVGAPCADPELIVTYQSGIGFPAGTGAAVGEIACEYLEGLKGGVCRLPSRATSITRQGVTVTLASATEFTDKRRIGMPVADAWLETVSGSGPRVASRVYSPDLARGFRV